MDLSCSSLKWWFVTLNFNLNKNHFTKVLFDFSQNAKDLRSMYFLNFFIYSKFTVGLSNPQSSVKNKKQKIF